jgi:hypothetical protein
VCGCGGQDQFGHGVLVRPFWGQGQWLTSPVASLAAAPEVSKSLELTRSQLLQGLTIDLPSKRLRSGEARRRQFRWLCPVRATLR